MSLLVAPAIRLPCGRDLLSQPHSHLAHPRPGIFNLSARLFVLQRGLEKTGFSRKSAKKEFVLSREPPRRISTITAGTLGWIGFSSG